ncbi:MAG: 4-hydroxy-tetrahydrodipicolinate synthase, partial [Pseudomonadota bacterium]
MFSGSIVALATPFDERNCVDRGRLGALIDFHVQQGSDGLVIAGTTGESATLTKEEHVDLVAAAMELADGRIPVIAGTGSNSTAQTVDLSVRCAELGVQGLLLVAPYYNKPTQPGMIAHFSAVADAVTCPVVLYNVPGRTCSDVLPDTVARLAEHPRIAGLKDATGDLRRLDQTRGLVPQEFSLLSGDDFTSLAFLLGGGHGVITVTGNVAPAELGELCRLAAAGRRDEAAALDGRLQPLHEALFLE